MRPGILGGKGLPAVLKAIIRAEENEDDVEIAGAWRLWFEHPAKKQTQGDSNPFEPDHTNPDHSFEVHPASRINQLKCAHVRRVRRVALDRDKDLPKYSADPHSRCGEVSNRRFTDAERAAMKERAQELKAEARRGPRARKADGESDVLAKIVEMAAPDRAMAERLHAIIEASAPALSPRTWYGMPAYAKVVCFFQSAHKFKTRYATFGFSDKANLDEGTVWPVAFALKELTAADEARIGALVKKAVS